MFTVACFLVRPVAAAWFALGVTAGFFSGAMLAALVGYFVLGTDVTFESCSQVVGYLLALAIAGGFGVVVALRTYTNINRPRSGGNRARNAL